MDRSASTNSEDAQEPPPGPLPEPLFGPGEFGEEVDEDASREVFGSFAVSGSYDTASPLRLRRVRLQNILGFRDSSIALESFSVLVGANNSGKSSLMRAIAFAQTLLKVHVERVDAGGVTLAGGRNLDDSILPVPEVRDLWYGGVRRVGNTWVLAQIKLEFESGLHIEFGLKGPFGHATSRLLTDRKISRGDYDRLMSFPIVYVPSSVGVVDQEEYRTPARIGSLISGGRAHEVLRNLLFDLQERGRLSEVSTILEEYFSGSIGEVAFDLGSDEYIHVTYREDSDHDLFSAGAGFIQVLQLVTFLIHEQPGVLLVDEPDAHLHSSLQRIVVDVLRRASHDLGIQILLATHSKEIVHYVDPEELLVVDRSQTELAGLGKHDSAISVLESLGAVDSVDAYQVIRSRRVLLVEGSSDRKVFRALASKRGSHVFEGADRLVLIETGGESTAAARSDLSILERIMDQTIESLQVLDRDARLPGSVERLEESAGRPLHIWRRDAIESYLVVPSAIARLIIGKRTEDDPQTVEVFVVEAVAEAVQDLRDETLDRASTKYRHDTLAAEGRNVEPSEANRVVREAMRDEDTLTRLTRGKDLLARVRERVQAEYQVSFGNQALIGAMQEGEVDPELWEFLDRIEELGG